MKFTKTAAVLLTLSWLSGCSLVPPTWQPDGEAAATIPSSTVTDVASATTDSSGAAEVDVPTRGPSTANPYTQTAIEVPATAQRLFQQAIVAQKAGNLTKAEVLLQELTASYPTLSGPFLNLGLLYVSLEKTAQAQDAFIQAIAANPNNLSAYNQLGILARQQGKFEQAEDYYLKALAVWPEHAQSHRNIGILYELYMGRLEEALTHYQRYQQLLPADDPQVTGWIVDLQRRIGSQNNGGR